MVVRKLSEPEKPYYTVEYNNQKVRQCRGFCNAEAPDEIEKFLDKWINIVNRADL